MENQSARIPEHLRPKNSGSDTLFKNGLVEKLSRTHISVPVTMHLIISVVVSYLALQRVSVVPFVILFVLGWVFWTFAEYWIHRYVYHVKTDKRWLLKIQHAGHGIHHQYPKDPTRLAMPPLPALILIAVFFGFFWLILRKLCHCFLPGFLFGYVLYISLHYAEHRYKAPKFGPLTRLWKLHMLHHYKYPETKIFGVSELVLWDKIFGTMPLKE
ncbi:MAG: sterol desaturase family protein [Cytophagales bacterium]|nr:sterol desaturase family protein [Cytophagales bacterium]